jgi:hypothetical protein
VGRLGGSLVVTSGSVQTKGTVGEELADKRVGGKGDGDAVKGVRVLIGVLGESGVGLRKDDTWGLG